MATTTHGYPTPKTAHSSRSCVPSTGLSTRTTQHWRPRSRSAAATGAPSATSQSRRRSLDLLTEHAAAQGAGLIPVLTDDARTRLAAVLGEAAASQRTAPGYAAELAIWSRRPAGGHDGTRPTTRGWRRGPRKRGAAAFPPGPAQPGATTPHGRPGRCDPHGALAHRRWPFRLAPGGEATSAALLIATQNGLATTVLSQAAEVADTGGSWPTRRCGCRARTVGPAGRMGTGRCRSPARDPAPSPALRAAGLAASVARTLTLGPSFTDDYRRYSPLQETQTWV